MPAARKNRRTCSSRCCPQLAKSSALQVDGKPVWPAVPLLARVDHACVERHLPAIADGTFDALALLEELLHAIGLLGRPEEHSDFGVVECLEPNHTVLLVMDRDRNGPEK